MTVLDAKEKKTNEHYRCRLLRVLLVVIFSLLIYAAAAGGILMLRFAGSVREYHENMAAILENVKYTYRNEQVRRSTQISFDEETYCIQTFFFRSTLAKVWNDETERYVTAGSLKGGTVFFEGIDGIFRSTDDIVIDLDRDELAELDGTYGLEKNNRIYTQTMIKGTRVIIRWERDQTLEERDLFAYAGEDQILSIVDLSTLRILRSNQQKLKGKDYIEVRGEAKTDGLLAWLAADDSSCTNTCGIGVSSEGAQLYEEWISSDNRLFTIQMSIKKIFREILRNTMPQLMLMLLVFAFVTIYTIRLFVSGETINYQTRSQKIGKGWYLDRGFAQHIAGFLVFGMVISLAVTVYLQLLIEYSTQNMRSEYDLRMASRLVAATQDDADAIENHFMDSYIDEMELFADMLQNEADFMDDDNMNTLMSIMRADEVTVFDGSGVSVASTKGYKGYAISSEEESPEYPCWRLIQNGIESLSWKDEKTGTYYGAVRRKDDTGIIFAAIDGQAIRTILQGLTLSKAMACANFNQADKVFVELSDPEIVYMIKNDGFDVEILSELLPEKLMDGTFNGQTTLDGKMYYVNELIADDILYISALEERSRWGKVIIGICAEIVGYCLFILMLLLFTAVHRHVVIAEPVEGTLKSRARVVDNGFMRMLHLFMIMTAVMLAAMVCMEMKFYSDSVLKYLFSSKWGKSFNLFSITMIVIFMASVNFASALLQRIIMLVAVNTGPRGNTLGKMLCSLIKFGVLLSTILYVLVELGAKLSYLLTGAGIAGVVIGYACQGVINDLLSGLFIVFEGHFQVGDWVSVGDWRGEVKEIGVRTTRISKGGDVRVFNNSRLSELTVLSPGMSGALCTVSVAYDEDLDRVFEIIENSAQRYRDACPHITSGPTVRGVTELGSSGIDIRIIAGIEGEEYAGKVERSIRKETKKIFDEHGITIPFPQIVVHDAASASSGEVKADSGLKDRTQADMNDTALNAEDTDALAASLPMTNKAEETGKSNVD